LGLYSAGRTAWWSVPDVDADRKAGAGTPSGRHGVARTTARSCLMMLTGLIALVGGLTWRYGPTWSIATLVHVVVLLIAAGPVLPARWQASPITVWMHTRLLFLVVLGEVLILAVPLAHLV
jgi:lycopene elongase/hydratase (dihydrobisanhydrobacterioruberin-forming)